MGFDLIERSRRLGRPQALLRLTRGSLVERYTAADRDVEIGADTYTPLAVSRTPIRDGGERKKEMVTVTVPINAPCAAWWRPYPPTQPVLVTWLAKHYGDAEAVIEWTGRVIDHKFLDTTLQLFCEQSRTLARKRGTPRRWQRGCDLALYSQGLGLCNVDKSLHDVAATLTAASGTTLTAAAFGGVASGRLAGGWFEWTRPDGETDRRSIVSHSGTSIVVNYGSADFAVDLVGTAYKGCKHTFADCDTEFDNAPNYGGSMYMPVRSPFDGNPT